MTASFSLRFRLKVYSLSMRSEAGACRTRFMQRPTVWKKFRAAGSPSALVATCLAAIKCASCTPAVLDDPQPPKRTATHHFPRPFQDGRANTNSACRDGLRVDAHAHTHRRRHRHLAQVDTLAGGRLG